jgi:hypothetical protein
MQEFLTNNTVNCNLMSLTGYRTLVILDALMKIPMSNDELNECLFNNQYIKEKFSGDTLRMYINSLRNIGCEIQSANKSADNKYRLLSHPFEYDIEKIQLQAIFKLYKNIYDKIEILDLFLLDDFFQKLSNLVKNKETTDFLKNISYLKSINKKLLKSLLFYCENKNQITFLYNSPKSGEKEIEIIADKLTFKSGKLYLWGTNLIHKEYSYFLTDRVLKILKVKLLKRNEKYPLLKVVYEVFNDVDNYILENNEKIISKTKDKILIEVTSENEFELIQKFLYNANNCKIKSPETFKNKMLAKLRAMKESYERI